MQVTQLIYLEDLLYLQQLTNIFIFCLLWYNILSFTGVQIKHVSISIILICNLLEICLTNKWSEFFFKFPTLVKSNIFFLVPDNNTQ